MCAAPVMCKYRDFLNSHRSLGAIRYIEYIVYIEFLVMPVLRQSPPDHWSSVQILKATFVYIFLTFLYLCNCAWAAPQII